MPVAKVEHLLAMLTSGRTDAVIMSETHFLGLRNSDPEMFSQIKVADFSFQAENRVHVGVSLKGRAVPHIDRLKQAIETLRERNVLEEVIDRELDLT
ncbi:hypothetical protein QW131_13445 [Roseibium salinum]|nr:hypothetical protein [Roseibium salinum]